MRLYGTDILCIWLYAVVLAGYYDLFWDIKMAASRSAIHYVLRVFNPISKFPKSRSIATFQRF
jgi:hypothetical protein